MLGQGGFPVLITRKLPTRKRPLSLIPMCAITVVPQFGADFQKLTFVAAKLTVARDNHPSFGNCLLLASSPISFMQCARNVRSLIVPGQPL
jgi:hypothetical protein